MYEREKGVVRGETRILGRFKKTALIENKFKHTN